MARSPAVMSGLGLLLARTQPVMLMVSGPKLPVERRPTPQHGPGHLRMKRHEVTRVFLTGGGSVALHPH